MTMRNPKQSSQRRALQFERPAECVCAGALVVDSAALQLWARRLFLANPGWSAKRVQQRAAIETLKGMK